MTYKECKYLIKSDLNRLTKVKWGGKIPIFQRFFPHHLLVQNRQLFSPPKGIFFKLLYRIVFDT